MEFQNNFMTVDYTAKLAKGISFPAKTSLIRTSEKLFIISPGPLDEYLDELEQTALQLVFVAPNNFHHFYLSKMKKRFPQAEFYGSLRAQRLSGVDLKPIKELEGLEAIKVLGNDLLGEYIFWHPESKSIITTDIIFNMKHRMNLLTSIMTFFAGTYKRLATSRLVLTTMDDKALYKDSLSSLLNLPFEQVIINHGTNINRSEFEIFVKRI